MLISWWLTCDTCTAAVLQSQGIGVMYLKLCDYDIYLSLFLRQGLVSLVWPGNPRTAQTGLELSTFPPEP